MLKLFWVATALCAVGCGNSDTKSIEGTEGPSATASSGSSTSATSSSSGGAMCAKDADCPILDCSGSTCVDGACVNVPYAAGHFCEGPDKECNTYQCAAGACVAADKAAGTSCMGDAGLCETDKGDGVFKCTECGAGFHWDPATMGCID